MPSWVAVAGPIVATIFVRRGSAIRADARRRSAPKVERSATRARERSPPRVRPGVAELRLDAEELVVLRDSVGARRGARLDLAGSGGNGEIRDRRVLGLARAVRDDGGVAVRPRERDGVQGLGERPDLVHLHEDRVRYSLFDPPPQPLDVRHEEVVADELQAAAEPLRELPPGGPLVLGEAVLDGQQRKALRKRDIEVDKPL